jgi:hypothetical protein
MSSSPGDDPVMRSSTERYDRVGVTFRWPQILAAASSIFFGFLLKIAVNPPSYFTYFDNLILLAALYAATVATAMFILPVIYHMNHYRKFDVERFLLRNKRCHQVGITCVMIAMYLGLGLALNSKLPIQFAYSLPSFPFIFILFELIRKPSTNPIASSSTNPIASSSTEHYDKMGASMRWCQILAAASSIFFGFLLDIAVNPPSYFRFIDFIVLLTALYAVTVATAMFFTPVIYHLKQYRKLDVDRFVLKAKKPVLIGITCVVIAMYLGLGLALNSKLPFQFAYGLPSLPFIFVFIEIYRLRHE